MFGYVKAYKPELRIKEFEMYKAVYCSLCKSLGKKYGIVSRFSLSYDFTFLSLLYLALRDGCVSTERKCCVCNPFKKCNYLKPNDTPDMPSAAAEIMLYCKLEDNIKDEGFFKSCFYSVLRALCKNGYNKAVKEFPELDNLFKEYIANQNKIEIENLQNIDAAADPTAKMLSNLFAFCGVGNETRALERLGYCMGRWIYLMDAAADLKDDLKKGRYNPLTYEAKKQTDLDLFLKQRLFEQLNICVKEAAAAFELIDIMRFKNILGNIIYLGLEDSQNNLFLKEKDKK